jgi:hypothetical protein
MMSQEPTRLPSATARKLLPKPAWFLMAFAVLRCLSGSIAEPQAHPTEYDVKAAYLFNFGKFVRYPADQPPNSFDICLLGHDPVARLLEQNGLDERVQDRPVHFKQFDKASDARACSIVFMGTSEAARIDKDLATLEGSNALTVSDAPKFIEHGGMIQFVLQNSNVRFAVNLSSAIRAHLALSSDLLRVAVYVKPSEEVQP